MSDMVTQTSYNGQSLFGSDLPLGLSDVAMSNVSIDNQESIEGLRENISSLFSDIGSATQKHK